VSIHPPYHVNDPSSDPSASKFSAPNIVSSATSARDLYSEPSTPSPTSLKKKKPCPRNGYGTNRKRDNTSPLHTRYWNEFDDGDEVPENEACVIYIDPEAPNTFPGAASLKRFGTAVRKNVNSMWKHAHNWVRPSAEGKGWDDPLRPLLESQDSYPQASAESSDSEDIEASLIRQLRDQERRRSILASRYHFRYERPPERERILFLSYLISFFASFAVLVPTAFLPFVGRWKEAEETLVVVVVGVAASLCFSIVGVTCLLMRKDNLGWTHRSAVALAFCIVCVAGGLLLSLGLQTSPIAGTSHSNNCRCIRMLSIIT
jgi:hypothetical protein